MIKKGERVLYEDSWYVFGWLKFLFSFVRTCVPLKIEKRRLLKGSTTAVLLTSFPNTIWK
jgi:hypothetical protein